jgi:hypothetical protein
MLKELVFDAETGSQVRLGNAGSNIACYMKHSSTFLWCLAYSVNGAPPLLWCPNNGPIPDIFRTADRIIAHSIEFERALWRHVLIPRYGFPPGLAAACGLPGAPCVVVLGSLRAAQTAAARGRIPRQIPTPDQ